MNYPILVDLLLGQAWDIAALGRSLVNVITEHALASAVGLVVTLAGSALAIWRTRRAWLKKEFYNRINLSLNLIEDGVLKIRTLKEDDVEAILLSRSIARPAVRAAMKTTVADPFLPLPRDEYWYFNNAILNEISELAAVAWMARLQGRATVTTRCVIGLTCEADKDVRSRKIRALVIAKETLQNLADEPPRFEAPNHATRWKTLKIMQSQQATHPERFLDVELISV